MLSSLFCTCRSEDSDRCCDLPTAIELKMSLLGQRDKMKMKMQWRHLFGMYSTAVHYANHVTA